MGMKMKCTLNIMEEGKVYEVNIQTVPFDSFGIIFTKTIILHDDIGLNKGNPAEDKFIFSTHPWQLKIWWKLKLYANRR